MCHSFHDTQSRLNLANINGKSWLNTLSMFCETVLRGGEVMAELKGVSGKQGLLIMIWKTVYQISLFSHPAVSLRV